MANYYVDALLIGTSWSPIGTRADLTYSFLNAMPSHWFEEGFNSFNDAQKTSVLSAMNEVSSFANVSFTNVNQVGDNIGQIAMGNVNLPEEYAAFAFYPSTDPIGGDVWVSNTYANDDYSVGSYFNAAIMHELGHTLGLKHSFEYPNLPVDEDSYKYTIMSYNAYLPQRAMPAGFMLYDIAALQHLYGANMNYNSSNTTYRYGDLSATRCIWDGGGKDRFDASGTRDNVFINLNPGSFSSVGRFSDEFMNMDNLSIAFGCIIEDAFAGDGDDILIGNDVANYLIGNGGNDAIYANGGDDIMYGDGQPVFHLAENLVTPLITGGRDELYGGDGNDIIDGGYENDYLVGDDGDDWLSGGEGNDSLYGGNGNDSLIAGDGWDYLVGGAGNDTYSIDDNFAGLFDVVVEDINSGVDTIWLKISTLGSYTMADNVENFYLYGAAIAGYQVFGNSLGNIMNGNSSADYLYGNDGNDTVSGGLGDDFLYGGNGNDILTGDAGNDTLSGDAGADKIDGGADSDTVSYASSNAAVTVNLTITTAQTGGHAAGDTLFSIENIIDTVYNDTLTGASAANNINGGAGTDTVSYANSNAVVNVNLALTTAQTGGYAAGDILSSIENIIGSAYNDTLAGNSAANNINGGNGIDVVSYASSAAAINVNLGITTAQSGGDAAGDILSNIENIIASAYNDTLISSSVANNINGGAGIDTVSYSSSNAAVTVNLTLATAQSGGGAAGDILSSIENITGSSYNDTLTALAAGSALNGGAGNDILSGANGNDILIGGVGTDTINGGAGSDTASYASSTVAVTINLNSTTAQAGGEAVGDILSGIENIIGSAYNDTLTSSSVANNLDGGAGVDTVSYSNSNAAVNVNLAVTTAQAGGFAAGDTMFSIENIIGSSYNDTLTSSSVANNINGAAGADTVSYASSTAGVNVNLGLTTAQSGGYAAGDILSGIENATGSAFNDTLTALATGSMLTGGAGNDILNGGNGNDMLIGGVGADTMSGGSGSDTAYYYVSNAAVNINLNLTTAQAGGEAAGDILSGIENITGSNYNDTFTSSSVANILYGEGGIDTVSYAASTAAVNVNLALSTAQIGGFAAGDTLFNIENIIGSGFNDTLTGTSAANNLNGGAGIDTVSYANSTVGVNVNLGLATAQTGGFAAGDILSNIENLTGSGFSDMLIGSSIANIIAGGAGKDTMTGGLGADIFKYSAVTDSGAASGVRDIITDFNKTQADKIDLADFAGTFVFKGTGAFTHTANEVNYAQVSGNTIIGIDSDGNGVLNFQIELAGLHTLAASDFLL